tara:strand:+ start:192 stop:1781 length:1590 start_codon:yes stop_codon:yes gene_type:complete
MLSVSNSLPVSNYSVKVVSEANGTVFNPQTNSRIRLTLPSSLGMVDMHSSYLQCKFRVVPPTQSQDGTPANRRDCYNMVIGEEQGIEACFRNVKISVDNKAVEEIQNYNVLHKFKKDFSEDNAQKTVDSVLDRAIQTNDGSGYYCRTYTPATPVATYNQPLKHIAKMGCSGVLSLPVGLPILATGKLDIEIELEDAARVLAPRTQFNSIGLSAATDGGGTFTFADIPFTDGTTGYDAHGFTGFADSPFAVGNTVRIRGQVTGGVALDFRRLITAVSDGGAGGTIRVTFATSPAGGANSANLTGANISLEIGSDENGALRASQYQYEISEVEYIVRSIEMPPPYLQSLQKRIQQNAFMMDIPTYSSYLGTLQAAINRQTINIPTFSSRVKSVLSVPVQAAQLDYGHSRRGALDNIRNYQAQIGSRREPSRAVDLTNTTLSTSQYASQEYLHELKKLLHANGVGVRSLRFHRENFAMCRSLSAMGGSEDLSDKGFRYDIEYNAAPTAKNVFSFVYHLKRIMVTPAGLQVMG